MTKENSEGENSKKGIDDRIKDESFRVKRILLELPNYSYYHSVIGKNEDDINNRFVGRKAIIDRLKSFIHETSKNTGTYLVTGFRGMGKTSVVNKAISSLNAKPRFTKYFFLWLLLLPGTVYYEHLVRIPQKVFDSCFYLGFFFLVYLLFFGASIYYFGYKNPLNRIPKEYPRFKRRYLRFKIGIVSIFNSSFQKHKFRFHRVLRSIVIFVAIQTFLAILFYYYENDPGNVSSLSKHIYFWVTTKLIVVSYFCFDIYEEYIRKKQRLLSADKQNNSEIIKNAKWTAAIATIIIYVLFFVFNLNSSFSGLLWQLSIFFLFTIVYGRTKFRLKRSGIVHSNEKYRTVFGRVIAFFDFQHYISVKVNLGKDKLTEKDVLKYVTNELLKEYRRWYYDFRSSKRVANIALHVFLILTISIIIYRTFLAGDFTYFALDKTKIAAFFPSQAVIGQDIDINPLFDDERFNSEERILAYVDYMKKNSPYSNISIGYESLEVLSDTTSILEKIHSKPSSAIQSDSLIVGDQKTELVTTGNIKELQISDQSLWNKFIVVTAITTNEIDLQFVKLWCKIRVVLLGNMNLSRDNPFREMASSYYPKVPVLAIFVIMVFSLIALRFVPNRFIILKTHFITIRALTRLRREIEASIEIEKSGAATAAKTSFFNYRKRTSYKPLEAKDITQRLIHILDEIANLSPIFVNLRFIFVFDELDKISTHFNSSIANIEDEFDVETTEVRYQVRRKERIGRILSSMKHFLNSAQAKFIFIAGREMYDAALAGISDRESSLDTIFNDNKIYVNSFYKENIDKNLADITSITEQYLCQFLIPSYFKTTNPGNPSLQMYNRYLKDVQKMDPGQRIKVMITLKDFVVYLTYRCNGAPRKLSNLLEQYIIPVCDTDIDSPESDIMRIVVGKNNENPYLKLGYYNQYKFSLISYLTSPIFLGIGNYMHEYSDKLLVSISYMLDHLFKHHKFGISYRSLSLTPEIVDINKEPQFREFLDKLIDLLSKSHLRLIVSGIYDYKFNGKITAEMKFLSKIDEYEAAAFNFTLDESIELKRHFNRRLESIKEGGQNVVINNLSDIDEDYVNNISLLHMMIGDLHFNDEEFQEAIVHYLDAIQIMRQRNYRDMNLYDFVLYVRNKLKLGLAFEKNKMYDNALMIFSELTDLIIRKRNISLRKIGLARFIINSKELDSFFALGANQNSIENLSVGSPQYNRLRYELENCDKREVVVAGRLKPELIKAFKSSDNEDGFDWKKLYSIEDMSTYYGLDNIDLVNNKLEDIPTNYKQLKHYFLLSTGESVRLLYQPVISKLHLIEKTSPDKLKDVDLIRAIKEFNFLKAPLNTEAKRVIVAEFYNKIGDLLYFKNGTLNMSIKYSLTEDIIDKYSDDKEKVLKAKKLLMSPLDACFFYIKSLAVLLISIPDEDEDKKNYTIDLIEYYRLRNVSGEMVSPEMRKFFTKLRVHNLDKVLLKIKTVFTSDGAYKQRYSSEYLSSVANVITDLADSLLSFTDNKTTSDKNEIQNFLYNHLYVPFWDILELYNYAKEIYASIGENRLARSQMIKVLYILNNCEMETINDLVKSVEYSYFLLVGGKKMGDFVEECIGLSKSTYNQSSYVELSKLKNLFKDDLDDAKLSPYFEDMELYTSVLGSEAQEVKTLYTLFLMKLCGTKVQDINIIKNLTQHETKENLKEEINTYLNRTINPHSIVHRKNNRLISLQLLLLNNKITKDSEHQELKKSDSLEYLILNSIGACNELIKLHNLFGINYVTTNYVELAMAHNKMGDWCKLYEDYKKLLSKPEKEKLIERTKQFILNSSSLNYLDKDYHYNLALDYNYELIDFHTRGSTLKQFKKPPSFLDDFYNDNIIHFLIALERNRLLRQSYLEEEIDKIKKKRDAK